jgi:4-amino-4-deoxy-L-arabinose transferase-like glycosyltransferase
LYDKKTGIIAAFFLFTFPLLIRLSSTAMVEPMLTFLFSLTLYLALLLLRKRNWVYFILIGLVVGLGLLTKYTMVFVLPILLGFVFLQGSKKQIVQMLAVLLVTVLVFAAAWFIAASRIDVFQTQVETIKHYTGLVLTNDYGRNLLFETVSTRLPSAFGVYNIPLIFLGCILLLSRRARSDWLIMLWLTAVWLPLMLTLPDHRYFMSSFPAMAILIAVGFQLAPKLLDRTALLAALYCAGSLYLFVDWSRAAQLFMP